MTSPPTPPVARLHLKGMGHVPSFKNQKMLTRGRIITNPKRQRWMDRAVEAIASQLLSSCRTDAGEIQPAALKRLRTALSALSDDSWRELPEGQWRTRTVPSGEEGAIIEIEFCDATSDHSSAKPRPEQ